MDLCASPSFTDSNQRCSEFRDGNSNHCQDHKKLAHKVYSKYKSHEKIIEELTNQKDSLSANQSDKSPEIYMKMYHHYNQAFILRQEYRTKFFMPELYDSGHEFAIRFNDIKRLECERILEE